MKKILFALLTILSPLVFAQQKGETLPPWQEGEMEIHHIQTGGGECVYCILPDGTTMMIDAGDIGPNGRDGRSTSRTPDDSRAAGQWIARYVQRRLPFASSEGLDYFYITHFHSDHMGEWFADYPITQTGGGYTLTGVTEVAEYLPIKKLVDRAYPGYDIPVPIEGKMMDNYRQFVEWNRDHRGMIPEQFRPGVADQFVLLHNPDKYKGIFEVRNLFANRQVWDGEKLVSFVPEDKKRAESMNENKWSSGICITYGPFKYYNGGDISSRGTYKMPQSENIEAFIGEKLGHVEVCEVNHHSFFDAMDERFIAAVSPRVFVIQVNNVTHVNQATTGSMLSKELYPGERIVVPTAIPEISRAYLGEKNVAKYAGNGGHVVIKVDKGGKTYRVILLTTEDESGKITDVFGPYECRQ